MFSALVNVATTETKMSNLNMISAITRRSFALTLTLGRLLGVLSLRAKEAPATQNETNYETKIS